MTPHTPSPLPGSLALVDPEVLAMIDGETRRLRETIQLIPSENYPSQAVMEATGSVFTTKYAEGYPTTKGASGSMPSRSWLASERAPSSAPTTQTSSRTPAVRPTWASTSPPSTTATPSWALT